MNRLKYLYNADVNKTQWLIKTKNIYLFFKTFTNQSQNQPNDNRCQPKIYTLDIYNIIRNSQIFTFNELKQND